MYEILIEKRAEKGLDRIPSGVVARIVAKIRELKENPRPAGCRKIEGEEKAYRIRIGDYRVVYEVDDEKKQIVILAAGHRKDIYRDF
jgi:mRNA interferase RelE/StbE